MITSNQVAAIAIRHGMEARTLTLRLRQTREAYLDLRELRKFPPAEHLRSHQQALNYAKALLEVLEQLPADTYYSLDERGHRDYELTRVASEVLWWIAIRAEEIMHEDECRQFKDLRSWADAVLLSNLKRMIEQAGRKPTCWYDSQVKAYRGAFVDFLTDVSPLLNVPAERVQTLAEKFHRDILRA